MFQHRKYLWLENIYTGHLDYTPDEMASQNWRQGRKDAY